jgi:TPR repeat protein
MKNFYEVLGVSQIYEPEVISAANNAKIRKYHHETNKSASAEKKAKEINEAYEVLKSAVSRREHDAELKRAAARNAPPPPPPPPPAGSSTAANSVQGTSGTNVLFIAVIVFLLLILSVAFLSATQTSSDEDPELVAATDAVDNADAAKCYEAVDGKIWQDAQIFCSAAAEKGDAGSATNLGYLYENGLGVETNQIEAVAWYKKAAIRGDAVGQFNLGLSYQYGTGVKADFGEAIRWLQTAADQGYEAAKIQLKDISSAKSVPTAQNSSQNSEIFTEKNDYPENNDGKYVEKQNTFSEDKIEILKKQKEDENRRICLEGIYPDQCDLQALRGPDVGNAVKAIINKCKIEYKLNGSISKFCDRFPKKAFQ